MFKPGDLIVCTDEPGYAAMRDEGFILGEVLEVAGHMITYKRLKINVLAVTNDSFYIVNERIEKLSYWFKLLEP